MHIYPHIARARVSLSGRCSNGSDHRPRRAYGSADTRRTGVGTFGSCIRHVAQSHRGAQRARRHGVQGGLRMPGRALGCPAGTRTHTRPAMQGTCEHTHLATIARRQGLCAERVPAAPCSLPGRGWCRCARGVRALRTALRCGTSRCRPDIASARVRFSRAARVPRCAAGSTLARRSRVCCACHGTCTLAACRWRVQLLLRRLPRAARSSLLGGCGQARSCRLLGAVRAARQVPRPQRLVVCARQQRRSSRAAGQPCDGAHAASVPAQKRARLQRRARDLEHLHGLQAVRLWPAREAALLPARATAATPHGHAVTINFNMCMMARLD